MLNPVSSAGQKGNVSHFELAGAQSFDPLATENLKPNVSMPADHHSMSEGHPGNDNQETSAIAQPSTVGGHCYFVTQPSDAADQSLNGAGHTLADTHNKCASATLHDDDGQISHDTLDRRANVVPCNGGSGHSHRDTNRIAFIRTLYKQRNDIIRAHGNLTRQVISICRHAVGFNTFLPKDERAAAEKRGNALLKALKENSPEAAIVMDSAGFLMQAIEQAGFTKQKALIERNMEKSVRGLGMEAFIAETKGFSATQLANIIGEAGDLANYATVARLWKRMGMAVINGKRQSKQSDVGLAFDHGYNPVRRSAMWNIGESLIKAQIRSPKDDDGKKNGESIAIGYYGQVYLERKADYAARHPEKTKAHIHNDAKRYMEKRLLRNLWKAWNRA